MMELEPGGQVRVGIIMGSPSDLPTMKRAGEALSKLGLEGTKDYEERVVSAHRAARWMMQYAEEAEERGLQVIIAGAGGSAHLPGMVASETVVPVLGVAVTKSPDTLNRALGSMIGMPEGKPLATFQGEAGAFNAGLFAARILALHNPKLREAIQSYDSSLYQGVISADNKLWQLGSEKYLAEQELRRLETEA
jgi:5-(carboxyamino)imidazole ribonucleotide mutase